MLTTASPSAPASERPAFESNASVPAPVPASVPAPVPAAAPISAGAPRPAPQTIALDGPAAAGKSTVGRAMAVRLGYLYLDTGVLYRALTWLALRDGVAPEDGPGLAALAHGHRLDVQAAGTALGYAVRVDDVDVTQALRTPEVDGAVSPVSGHAEVRDALMAAQRRVAWQGPVVMVGRDIGTVVLPDADLKIYLDASSEARAVRRYREKVAAGEAADLEVERVRMRRRDALDTGRSVAPLAVAHDAVVVNTDRCDEPAVVEHLLALAGRWPDPLTTNGGLAPCGEPLP